MGMIYGLVCSCSCCFVSNLTFTFVTHCRFASPQTQHAKFVTSLRYGIADGYKRMKKEEKEEEKDKRVNMKEILVKDSFLTLF